MLIASFENVVDEAIEKRRLGKVVFLLRAAEFLHLNLGQDFLGKSIIKCMSCEPASEKHQVMNILLELGAKPNFKSSLLHCSTPLEAAIRRLDLAAIKLLVKAGADPVAILPLAVNHEVIDWDKKHLISDNPDKVEILEFLLASSRLEDIAKSFFAQNKSLASAVYEALENGEFMIAEMCLKFGFQIDTSLVVHGCSGLELAYRTRKKEIAQWYLDRGASDCAGNYNQMTEWLENEKSHE